MWYTRYFFLFRWFLLSQCVSSPPSFSPFLMMSVFFVYAFFPGSLTHTTMVTPASHTQTQNMSTYVLGFDLEIFT